LTQIRLLFVSKSKQPREIFPRGCSQAYHLFTVSSKPESERSRGAYGKAPQPTTRPSALLERGNTTGEARGVKNFFRDFYLSSLSAKTLSRMLRFHLGNQRLLFAFVGIRSRCLRCLRHDQLRGLEPARAAPRAPIQKERCRAPKGAWSVPKARLAHHPPVGIRTTSLASFIRV
jgi:hypothetical protein